MKTSDVRINLETFSRGKVVSWENLSVTSKVDCWQSAKIHVCRQEKSQYEKPILTGLCGLVRPGEMVALMGARY